MTFHIDAANYILSMTRSHIDMIERVAKRVSDPTCARTLADNGDFFDTKLGSFVYCSLNILILPYLPVHSFIRHKMIRKRTEQLVVAAKMMSSAIEHANVFRSCCISILHKKGMRLCGRDSTGLKLTQYAKSILLESGCIDDDTIVCALILKDAVNMRERVIQTYGPKSTMLWLSI